MQSLTEIAYWAISNEETAYYRQLNNGSALLKFSCWFVELDASKNAQ